ALHEAFRERLEALPGVESAGGALGAPLSGIDVYSSVDVEGWRGAERPPNAGVRTVTPGYFETLGIPLRAGRRPSSVDGLDGARVAWVNEAAAEAWWPGQDPLGRQVDLAASVGLPESEARTVVGVVGDTRFRGARREVPPEVYVPHGQNASRSLEYFVRLRDDAPPPYPAARRALAELHPALPLDDDGPLAGRTAAARADTRLWAALMGGFGLLALGLAAVGLFGVVAQQVTVKRREIGIRMAMGARGERVVRRLVVEGLRPAVLGVGLGLVLAAFGTRLLEGLLFRVAPGDPWAWGASVVLLIGVAAGASFWPACRAVRVDPVDVMRAR
ncbi:MAG TPA: FtsX-like permease family protein, partial [Longimicrobiales bacterium]|nr:FtsX-like permease family protein [Longimicrobiales bacterium]